VGGARRALRSGRLDLGPHSGAPTLLAGLSHAGPRRATDQLSVAWSGRGGTHDRCDGCNAGMADIHDALP
jgi:hypothetical protein